MINIKKFFLSELKKVNNDYLIIRNYDSIISNQENDIDILLTRNCLKEIYNLLENEIIKNNYEIQELPDKIKINFLGQGNCLFLDFHYELTYYGINYANTKTIFENKYLNSDGIYELKKEYASLISLINRLLHKRKIKENDLTLIKNLIKQDNISLFFKTLKKELAILLINELGKDKLNLDFLRIRFIQILRFKNYTNILKEINYRFLFSRRKSIIPKGGILVLLGTHGAGKTTTCDSLKKLIKELGLIPNVLHSTSRPGLLPNIYKSKGEILYQKNSNKRKNRIFKPLILIHSLRVIYHIIDYWFFWLKSYNDRNKNIFIFDRFLYDYLVEPRNTYGMPLIFKRLLFKFAPKPNLVAVIWENPETIFQRKKELSLSRLKFENNGYLRFSKLNYANDYRTNIPSRIISRNIMKDFLLSNKSLPRNLK